MEETAILNYPGSKRRLLNFIFENTKNLIDKNKVVLDIFAGTGCVAQFFKSQGYLVSTNDTEVYSYHISNAILNGYDSRSFDLNSFFHNLEYNKTQLYLVFAKSVEEERRLITEKNLELTCFDENLPKIWKNKDILFGCGITVRNIADLNRNIDKIPFSLFTLYYSGSYFGLEQSIEIDSIRYAIERSNQQNKSILLTCLYYAMKEASFSKDGHMAQPLNHQKNFNRLILSREKNIYNLFLKELNNLSNREQPAIISKNYNMPFENLIEDVTIFQNIGMIYADPPYTDMQYSRYFHLLTTVSNYQYPTMTVKKGKLTTGLYADNRFQSTISNHKTALSDLSRLMKKASSFDVPLVFSYAFPVDRENQPVDRYTMNIDDLILQMKKTFKTVTIFEENFQHCNNRNSSAKKVIEYLIVGKKARD